MKVNGEIWVLGGDRRMRELSRLLWARGLPVHSYAQGAALEGPENEESLEGVERAQAVVFPIPLAGPPGLLYAPLDDRMTDLRSVFQRLRPGQFLAGGRVDPDSLALAKERGLALEDYYAQEELAVANAVPTAEGCIQLALESMPITLQGARVLVLGYGRLGRACAPRFAALGSRVTAAARRSEQLAWARAEGLEAVPLGRLKGKLGGYDLVINTIPARILGSEALSELRRDCLILDLASAPGGADPEAVQRLGLRCISAPGLPGRTAPVTAAQEIARTLAHLLEKRRDGGD